MEGVMLRIFQLECLYHLSYYLTTFLPKLLFLSTTPLRNVFLHLLIPIFNLLSNLYLPTRTSENKHFLTIL